MEAPGSFHKHMIIIEYLSSTLSYCQGKIYSVLNQLVSIQTFSWIRYANELQTLQIPSNQNLNKAFTYFQFDGKFCEENC